MGCAGSQALAFSTVQALTAVSLDWCETPEVAVMHHRVQLLLFIFIYVDMLDDEKPSPLSNPTWMIHTRMIHTWMIHTWIIHTWALPDTTRCVCEPCVFRPLQILSDDEESGKRSCGVSYK